MSKTKDINGKESTKRFVALRFIMNAMIMSWIVMLVWVITVFMDKQMPEVPPIVIYIIGAFLASGLATIGMTLVEPKNLIKPKE